MADGERRDYRSLGEILKDARDARGLSLQELSDLTKITPRMIEALEADDLDQFDSPIYARSFVRTLAEALGLETGWLVTKLDHAAAAQDPRPAEAEGPDDSTWHIQSVRVRKVESRSGPPRSLLWVGGLVLLLIAAGVVFVLLRGNGTSEGPAEGLLGSGEEETTASAATAADDPAAEDSSDDVAEETSLATEPEAGAEEEPSASPPGATESSDPSPAPVAEDRADAPPPVERETPVEQEEAVERPVTRGETPAPRTTEPEPEEEVVVRPPDRGLGSILRPEGRPSMELVIRALARVEVWAAADGGSRQRRSLSTGEVWRLTADDHFSLQLGDPGAVEVLLDGKRRVPPPGLQSEWILYPETDSR